MDQNLAETFCLDGKVAMVTGAARGLGEVIAKSLARAGAKILVTDILQEEGQRVAEEIRAAGGEAAFCQHDVTQEEDWQLACGTSLETFGALNVLVNNAGVEIVSPITEMSLEAFRLVQQVNVEGTFLGLKHAINTMKPGGAAGSGGSIVNLSSIAGIRGFTGLNAYCASKGAVKLMTKAAAVECADLKYGIRVNSVHPGLIETTLGKDLLQQYVDTGLATDVETVKEAVIAKFYPAGHLGQPEDVSNAVLFLASEASKWVTGAQLSVDGGSAA